MSQPNRHAGEKLIATNKQARRLYEFLEVLEAGLVLMGSELKSLREGQASLADAFATVDDGEIWLRNVHIPEYRHGSWTNHEPRRNRKLLLHLEASGESLNATLELAPKHAEAHTALALYHAEIINKIGAMIGGLTYGAKAAEAESHIKTALKLTPDSPIAHVEHGNVLLLLYGDKKEDDAATAFEKAGKLKPKDAMEALDAAYAKSQLE